MKRLWLCLPLSSCILIKEFTEEDTGDFGTLTNSCPEIYTGPLAIARAAVTCEDNVARFELDADGLTEEGHVYMQETGGPYQGGQWSENHTLVTYEFDVCGFYDKLERELQDGRTLDNPLDDYETDVSTVFSCEMLEDNDYMTFAFAIDDINGQLAGCVAFGHDVQGMKNGVYTVLGEAPQFNLADCVDGTEGL